MSVQKDQDKFFLSISQGEKKPFDFLRVLYYGCIAGGAAGVVVETALYPIDTIKTRLQVARDGGKIVLKGLYSGLAGNIVGVLPASAIFIGVYEPTKQQLLKSLPENLSAVAHFAARAIGGIASSVVRVPTELLSKGCRLGNLNQPQMLSVLLLLMRVLKVFLRDMDLSYCEIYHLML
uniref:Uncharacterized protein n=1 Tax=Glycine max TaxID=3847 RepID=C6TML3_SOYBN|nr:unknown [Glycine max]